MDGWCPACLSACLCVRLVGGSTFYPEVTIVFEVVNPHQHYHVPLLLNPYGYSTYRGS